MKKLLLYIGAGILLLSACHDLNLNPLSSGSTENWYSTETEVQMAVDELYRYDFWPEDGQQQTDWSDDYTSRDLLTLGYQFMGQSVQSYFTCQCSY